MHRKDIFRGGGGAFKMGFFKIVIIVLIYSLSVYIGNEQIISDPHPTRALSYATACMFSTEPICICMQACNVCFFFPLVCESTHPKEGDRDEANLMKQGAHCTLT